MRIYRNQVIEELAEKRLSQLEQILGKPLSAPVPIDLLAEKVLGLDFLWEAIEELPGEVILGGLVPGRRLILLNEKRQQVFNEKPGLERSTKGHEMGHWDLFIDKARLAHPTLFPMEGDGLTVLRSSPAGEVAVLKFLLSCPEGEELLRKLDARADAPDEARAVNRYAAAISMPRALLRAEALQVDRTRWPDLYGLAKKFEVTISALRVRLEQLDLLYVDKDGRLFESRDQATGQLTFGF